MVTEFVVVKKDHKVNINEEAEDLRKFDEIRGRLLNMASILEKIMKEYCEFPNSKKMMFGNLKNKFLKKLKSNGYSEYWIKYFRKLLNEINPDRNDWTHGLVYYEERFDDKANNFIILNKETGTSVRKDYFDRLDDLLFQIWDLFQSKGLWKLKDYDIYKVDINTLKIK